MSFTPTERILVRPETQGDYSPTGLNVIKFHIPESVGYIDTNDLVLRAQMKMKNSATQHLNGRFIPNPREGVSSIIRNFQVRSGNNNAVIEQIDTYNGLCAATLPFEENDTIKNRRAMTEGFVYGGDSSAGTVFAKRLTPTQVDKSTLQGVREAGMAQTGATDSLTPMIELPFHRSGVLAGGMTFPVKVVGGLRVELQLDTVERSLLPMPCYAARSLANSDFVVGTETGSKPPSTACIFKIHYTIKGVADGTTAAGAGATRGYRSGDNDGKFDIVLREFGNEGDLGGWRPGMKVYIFQNNTDDSKAETRELGDVAEVKLGTQFAADGDFSVNGNRIILTIDGSKSPTLAKGGISDQAMWPANGATVPHYGETGGDKWCIFYTPQETIEVMPDGVSLGADKFNTEQVLPTSQADYTLSDLALVFNKVTPPDDYDRKLMKEVASNEGKTIEFPTYSLIRNTLPATNGMLSQNIPCVHEEAYSILSVPYDSTIFNSLYLDQFDPDMAGAKNYQYFIEGEAVPNRAVTLDRLNPLSTRLGIGKEAVLCPEALHLREMVKALSNAYVPVRNLLDSQHRSILGRAFSRQGQVADMSNGDLRLQTEYADALKIKQFDHHVCFCAEMNVQDMVVSVRR